MLDLVTAVGSSDSPPFLEVLTRCYQRPAMLAANKRSIARQSCPSWQQTMLIDREGYGVEGAYARLSAYAPELTGRYIWILDDDDECARPELVAELFEIAAEHDPDVIMLRMDHGPLGVKPEDPYWQHTPAFGHVGCSAYVVRREVWQKYAYAFLPGAYHSDYRFIATIFASSPAVYWHDVIASRVQRISKGSPE